MKDQDIRCAVHHKLLKDSHLDPNCLIVDEFSISLGASRADIAVINGIIHGYELKSESDSLDRLPFQIQHYSSVMDKVTLVVAEKHLLGALKLIPDWWGVKTVSVGAKGAIHIKHLRSERLNRQHNSLILAQLLWKDECIDILQRWGCSKGYKSKPRFELWNIVAEKIPISDLRFEIRNALKKRVDWKTKV
ncbi:MULTISPECIES: sce7726 family protein [Proteus]|uniref:sce7726 family protein n=1 Tax=Proteus TaxID=583 RepID=UPI001377ACE6|nr:MULTISPECIES: sce7726 family protein [Proteus]MBG2839205.1 sce7726 family protein [Proteus terrae subsp. cibarius]MBG2870382.1 sce7726 family protein [Proteus terrae subsp. cibarius]NBN85279.1 sce7726 family protein [Proteus sp. G2300]